jgi:uncharacterized protein YndB with AHSA1/START domain
MATRASVSRRTGTKRGAARKARTKAGARAVADKALKLAGVGSQAVLKATGRAWDDWLKVLDRAGAKSMAHKDIATLLSRKFSVPGWWCQMVTVGYEQARGLRVRHETAQGFRAQASKTVGVDVHKLFAAWSDGRQRNRWLPGAALEIRRETEPKSMRVTWGKGEDLDLNFYAKGPGKSLVQVQHGKLANEAAVKRSKAFWTAALERLKAQLEGAR